LSAREDETVVHSPKAKKHLRRQMLLEHRIKPHHNEKKISIKKNLSKDDEPKNLQIKGKKQNLKYNPESK